MTDRTKIERVGWYIDEAARLLSHDSSSDIRLMITAQMIQTELLRSDASRELDPGESAAHSELNALLKDAPAGTLLVKAAADRIKVLEEALRRALEVGDDGKTPHEVWDAIATLLDGYPPSMSGCAETAERGLASIYEAAGVER